MTGVELLGQSSQPGPSASLGHHPVHTHMASRGRAFLVSVLDVCVLLASHLILFHAPCAGQAGDIAGGEALLDATLSYWQKRPREAAAPAAIGWCLQVRRWAVHWV